MHFLLEAVLLCHLISVPNFFVLAQVKPFYNHSDFLNYGEKKKPGGLRAKDYLENSIFKSKIDVLGEVFKTNIDVLKASPKLDLIFLIDGSSSVGEENFKSELKFVKKLLSDVTVDYDHARVAVVTFSSASSVIKSVDEITVPRRENNKCLLLNKQLVSIEYKGGETYTLGAFELANKIFENSRNESKKVVFLITDGFSNGGDPVPLAAQMKKNQITIFTIGIRNGNYRELYELSSSPGEFHSYLLDSFEEFESLARRALHVDLKSGDYIPLGITSPCNGLCETGDCCDRKAWCSCGTSTGHYSCMCLPGYYGSGLKNSCLPCPAGTYADGPNLCLPCPDIHHTTIPPAYGIESCKCKTGFQSNLDNQCEIVKCPKVSQPEHGYFVKKRDCDNVLNSACGIRCEVGYTLSGNSIRLCQNDATWSGEQPSCQVKTCSKLQQPAYGSMVCAHPDLGITYADNETALPVDTVCSFKCEDGKTLIGSKHRTCLPLARWDGLKTSCKQIKCPKLAPIQHGRIDPLSCTIGKQPFGKKCKILCDQGYQTEGPSEKSCTGNHGLWDTKYENTVCKDLIPPSIECPGNMTASAQLGQQYGIAVWKHPEATDNADSEVSFWMKPVIENITTYQFPIGQTKITYFAQDAYQNQANCSFFITVIDEERPVIEDCEDPPTFLTSERGGANVTWDEPNIYDNSQNVTINKTHEYGLFPFGTTSVTYTAVDGSGNKNVCVMNITVEEVHCEALPDPIYGHSECSPEDDGMQCVITCQEGYAVPLSQPQGSPNDSNISFMCNDAESIWYNHEGLMFPECSVTEVPKHVEQSGIVSVTSDMDTCNDTTEVENDVRITLQETSCFDNCTVTLVSDCEDEESIDEEKTNIIKREISNNDNGDNINSKRGKKRKRVNVTFQVYGKYSNETQENINIYGNYNVSIKFQQAKYICPDGFVARRNRCVRCPKGTFNNATMKSKCQSCPYGYYNDQFGQTECKPCPLHHSTRRIHSKKREDCREQCPPGTHARKKITKQNKRNNTTTTERTTLQPRCRSCAIGYYQPNYNQLRCISCPKGYTTPKTGATAKTHCTPFHQNTCLTYPQICNGGKCIPKGRYYSCSCPQGYLGSHCERKLDHCESNPCLNGAFCENSAASFRCLCRAGFVGRFCEDLQEICPTVCLNGGKCYQNDIDDYFCTCPEGFGGETCEVRMRLCQSNLCENNATCVEDSEGFRCKCKDGYIGRRCNILPCDYRPCPGDSICVNTMDRNATKNSFKCVCPEGFTGTLCEEKLDPCSENPCLNDGECRNNGSTFTCVCSKLFQGQKCESKRTSKYVLNFSKFSLEDYVKLTGFPNNITEITACLWMQTKDNFNYGTLMSYATKDYDNAFTLTDYTGLVLYINNQYTVTDVLLNDGLWHHICVSWENSKGAYRLYVDGKTVKSGSGLASGAVIEGKGNMVIGQEQDVLGGKFSQSETYLGKMAYIDVWSRELHRDEMVLHMNDCQDLILGDVYAWPEIQENVQGNVQIENSSFCGSCSEPKSVYNGLIDVVDNVAYYECYKGYKLSGADYSSGRRCTKAAKWEGLYEPFCKRVSCGYPGYVRNSYTIGNSYLYQDKVVFQCHEGYNLTGGSTITCLENGTWYPEKPQCAGAQCMAFKKPAGANLVVIAEHSYEDFIENLSTFDVGTQVELTCTDEKVNLTGENVITCQENGTWDFEPPQCISPSKNRADSCDIKKIPAPPNNGYVEIGSFYNIGNGTGNTVEYKCRNGYELIGEDTSTCIIDGYWTEPNITCNPITCVLPKFKNMIIANEEIQKEVYQFGNMIKFDCKDGFRIFGDNTVRCLANRKWSRMKAKCTRKSCRKPEVKDTTIIEGNSYFFEDEVTIICSSKSRYVLNCNSFSMWIGERDETC